MDEQKQFIDIEMKITNKEKTSLDLDHVMAMVFFTNKSTDDPMDPFTYKYFVDFSTDGKASVAPNQDENVHLRLIAPAGVDLTKRSIHVKVVAKKPN